MNEFIYDLRDVERELEARGEKVPTTATMINKIKKLQLYRKCRAIKTDNGYITPGGQKGSKWLLTEEGMQDLVEKLIKRQSEPTFDLIPELQKEMEKRGRLRKTDHNSYLIEVDADIVNKFQNKGYKWKEDISRLVNSLLENQYQVYDAIEKKEQEIQEAKQRYEELQKELTTMNQRIGV